MSSSYGEELETGDLGTAPVPYPITLLQGAQEEPDREDLCRRQENALRIQIWTAQIALLLLKWLHHLSKANWSLSKLASMLRLNLFTDRNLTKWLADPMETVFRHSRIPLPAK